MNDGDIMCTLIENDFHFLDKNLAKSEHTHTHTHRYILLKLINWNGAYSSINNTFQMKALPNFGHIQRTF